MCTLVLRTLIVAAFLFAPPIAQASGQQISPVGVASRLGGGTVQLERTRSTSRSSPGAVAPSETSNGVPAGLVGAGIGIVVGGGFGYALARGLAEGAPPSGSSVRRSVIRGAVFGGVLGFALEHLFRWANRAD